MSGKLEVLAAIVQSIISLEALEMVAEAISDRDLVNVKNDDAMTILYLEIY